MADYWLVAYLMVCGVFLCRGLPFANEQPIDIKDPAVQIGVDYLQRFDYLPPIGGSGTISKKVFKKSLKQMQNFSGLKVTGKLDNETLTLMGTTRCGVPDPIKVGENGQVKRSGGKLSVRRFARAAFTGGKWKSNEITYRIINFTPDIPIVQTQNAIERAFQVWSDVTPLTFRRLDTGSADIHLRFDSDANHGDGYRFDGAGGIFGHAFPPENALNSLDGDVHFDDDEDFTFQTTAGINLFQVAAHLIGHSLGLAHSSDPEALMAPFYKNFIPQFQLPLDDTEGIQRIYGVKPINEVENSPAETTEDEAESSRPCNRVYDAVGFLRGDIFMFKDDRYWRLYFIGVSTSDIIQGDPINRFWSGLPKSIDATYERLDSTILFFKGSRYWEYKSNEPKPGYPKPISDLSPDLPDRIDAALTWPDYGKTYFFRRNQVWRFDEKRREVDNAYPKLINETWKGVPDNIDSAFSYRNGCTYFVKGKKYYRYNNRRQFVENGFPRSFGVDFLMCRAVDD